MDIDRENQIFFFVHSFLMLMDKLNSCKVESIYIYCQCTRNANLTIGFGTEHLPV